MEELNILIEKFIKENKVSNSREFFFASNLSTIIERNLVDFKYPGFKNKIELKKSLKLTRDFLNSLSANYGQIFDENIENIELKKLDKDEDEFAYSDVVDDKPYIYLPYNNKLKDAFTLTHEMIHTTTVMDSDYSLTRNIFCEAPAICSEMMFKDYLKEKGVKEYNLNDIREIISVIYYNKINIFQTMLLDEFLDRGYVSASSFMDMLSKYNLEDSIEIANYISDNVRNDDFDIFYLNRYIIGYIFACLMYDKLDKESFVELNDMINEYEIVEFLDYLDLEYKDDRYLDLTRSSYEKLEDSYKKKIKMIG